MSYLLEIPLNGKRKASCFRLLSLHDYVVEQFRVIGDRGDKLLFDFDVVKVLGM